MTRFSGRIALPKHLLLRPFFDYPREINLSLSNKFYSFFGTMLKQDKAEQAKTIQAKHQEIEKQNFSEIIGMKIDSDTVLYLRDCMKEDPIQFVVDDMLGDLEGVDIQERKVKYLVSKSLDHLLHLMDRESLTSELNELQNNGRGRKNKEDANKIARIKKQLNNDSRPYYFSFDRDAMFASCIESYAEEEGSNNKAYQRYVEEFNAEYPEQKIVKDTVRRRFERYKKEKVDKLYGEK